MRFAFRGIHLDCHMPCGGHLKRETPKSKLWFNLAVIYYWNVATMLWRSVSSWFSWELSFFNFKCKLSLYGRPWSYILPRLHLIWTSTQGLLVEPHSPPPHLVSDNTSVNIGDIRDSWGGEHVNIGPLSCFFHSAYLTSAVVVARNAKLRSFGKKRNDAKQSWRLVLLFFLLAFLYLKFSLILHSYILIFQSHLLVLCK